ncbi:MAG TPA: hypothetical protein VKT82_15340 [Ktedonobacterales bacterium]|nr:hypothetical protein [Ktedonobacterales bacterium]
MESITHAPGSNASTRKPRRTARSSTEHAPDQIRGFYYDARRAALGHDYLRRKWLPREGPLFYAFIQVMRSFCYFNSETGELREDCWPSVPTIAARLGVDPATVHRLIQRDKTTGEFISTHAEALKRFIKVQPRWLYNPQVGHKTQRSSVYLVAMDDPPTPEDDHLVEEKAGELAAILTMETVRQQHQAEIATDSEAENTDLQNASQLPLAKCESVMSRKMQDKTLPLTLTFNKNEERTLRGRCSIDWSIGKQKTEEGEEKALIGGGPAAPTREEPGNLAQRSPQPPRTPHPNKSAKHQLQAQALARVHPQVGATIHQTLVELGGSNPDGGVQTILEALVEVAAPPEQMPALFALGQQRLGQQQDLLTIPNPTGYLIGIMRRVAVEAMLKGWKVDQMRAEDEEKHAQALRSAAQAGSQVLTYDGSALPLEEALTSEVVEGADTAPTPAPAVSEEVEVADAAIVATWRDSLPDPRDSQLRSVSMLWGFVREEISGHLNVARRSQLEALTPKWDATRPRTLLLLSNTTWGAQGAYLNLRREIDTQIGILLSDFFDEMQVVYAPTRVQGEEAEGGKDLHPEEGRS